MDDEKFLIILKPPAAGQSKPQQKSIWLNGEVWDIEWSTAKDIPMTVDFFNLTIGRVIRDPNAPADTPKKIEEVWRVTGIPGHSRKLRYGSNDPQATATQAKSLENGIYVVKVAGMTGISSGLNVESGVGAAIVNLNKEADWAGDLLMTADETSEQKSKSKTSKQAAADQSASGVQITNETVLRLFKIFEEENLK